MPLRHIKPEIRIIGWDDTRHVKESKHIILIGAIYRGANYIDGMLSTIVTKDGTDSTEKISQSIRKSRHYDQLSVIMTDGITFGGFNIVDLKKLNKLTKLPVIAIQRKKPDMKKFMAAIKKVFPDWKERISIVKRTGNVNQYRDKGIVVYYQYAGMNKDECEKILELTCIHGNIPEPIRVAHLIASGLSGESKGRA